MRHVHDAEYRDTEIARIADMVIADNITGALKALKVLRTEYDASYSNFAGRLIDELRRRPHVTDLPHIRSLIDQLEASGVNHAAATR